MDQVENGFSAELWDKTAYPQNWRSNAHFNTEGLKFRFRYSDFAASSRHPRDFQIVINMTPYVISYDQNIINIKYIYPTPKYIPLPFSRPTYSQFIADIKFTTTVKPKWSINFKPLQY